ncbi:hypothetical protein BELL_0651g00040 [Botrytis elliptica]|uniref:O-methyltransferase C-terminal domain-containing protein n=1 Tax=Botrytis elliptica TaxID=278938 RepID=A0A4Z1JAZ1_9HELO|nr:hypothetical protein EAE99_004228 [Botrytis elliptica]TGO70881.1 hypothetical protein BELL_0651g00040 [Botrytis elliptica]
MSPATRIAELAATIQRNTSKVDEYLTSNNIPSPSFDVSCPFRLSLPPDIQASRNAILEASDELTALMLGPVESLIPPPNAWISVTALQRFGIAKSFPPTRTSTFLEIAEKCSIPESDARSLIRHAMTFYIFHEPSPGIIAHTASSKALAEIPPVSDFIGFVSEEMLPASTRLVDAMIKWPGSQESNESGYALVNGTDVPMMQYISRNSRRSQQMGKAMTFLKSRPSESVQRVLEKFPWDDAANGLVVDVGGAKGTVGIELLRFLPKLKCIVQDQLEVVRDTTIPDDLQDRLSFMAHDFFQEQSVKGADIYLICNVLHDWSDKYAARILKGLIPALKRGARVLVCDRVLPAPCTLTPYQMRRQRADDLYMKGIQNARVRDPNHWEQLFLSVDERFKSFQVGAVDGSELSTICVTWEGEDMFEM